MEREERNRPPAEDVALARILKELNKGLRLPLDSKALRVILVTRSMFDKAKALEAKGVNCICLLKAVEAPYTHFNAEDDKLPFSDAEPQE